MDLAGRWRVSALRAFLLGGALLGWSLLVMKPAAATETDDSDPPNLVLILADDLGYGDPRCYAPDSRIPTPNLDRLAAEGRRFTDAHSPSSVCSPTRYALLTGRYAWRTELHSSVLWPWDPPLIEPGRLTLPELLRRQGYRTACIGKWHLGWDWPRRADALAAPDLRLGVYDVKRRQAIGATIDFTRPVRGGPLERGFDEYFGDDVPNFPPYGFLRGDRLEEQPDLAKPADMFGHPGPMVPGWDLAAVMPALAGEAVAFLERQSVQQPFFLYLPLTAPHTPIAPSGEFLGKSEAGRYGDFVHQVDGCVGAVLAALDQRGLAANTLVIFTSDNGSPARDGTAMSGPTGSVQRRFGHAPSGPWRGMKSDVWEGGHRVPFLARWPGRVPAGTASDQLVCLVDLLATVAAILEVDLPEGAAEDSFDVLPALLDDAGGSPIRDHLVHHSGNGTFGIRSGNWKLIPGNLGSGGFTRPARVDPGPDDPRGQLYHLGQDPGETDNRFDRQPAVVARLAKLLEVCRAEGRTRPGQVPPPGR